MSELTTVVLDGNVFCQQLVLASHTDEQRTSSPARTRMEVEGRDGMRERGRESAGEVRDRKGLTFVDTQCLIHKVSRGAFANVCMSYCIIPS